MLETFLDAAADLESAVELRPEISVFLFPVFAEAFVEKSVNVVIHYRDSEKLAATAVSNFRKKGCEAWMIKADFNNIDETESLIARCRTLTGKKLDIMNHTRFGKI